MAWPWHGSSAAAAAAARVGRTFASQWFPPFVVSLTDRGAEGVKIKIDALEGLHVLHLEERDSASGYTRGV